MRGTNQPSGPGTRASRPRHRKRPPARRPRRRRAVPSRARGRIGRSSSGARSKGGHVPKASTGGVVEKTTSRGTSFALRFRALGERQFLHLGYASEGWTRARADEELRNVLADVRRGIWQPPPNRDRRRRRARFPRFTSSPAGGSRRRSSRAAVAARASRPPGRRTSSGGCARTCCPRSPHKRIDEISVEDVDHYRRAKVKEAERRRAAVAEGKPLRDRDGRRLRPLSVTSINKTLTTLAAILEVAVEYELVAAQRRKGSTAQAAGEHAAADVDRSCGPHRGAARCRGRA